VEGSHSGVDSRGQNISASLPSLVFPMRSGGNMPRGSSEDGTL